MVEINEKQAKMAKLKSQGMKNKDIAKIYYPEAKDHAGEVIVSRELKKPHVAKYIDKGREIAIKKHGITWERLITKLEAKLEAIKIDYHTGELLDDNATQLAAIKMLATMLSDDKPAQIQGSTINDTELVKAINNKNMNEVELSKLTFRNKEE